MNLLEHYIVSISEETRLKNGLIHVRFFGDCWGDKREYSITVTEKSWEYSKKQGFILL